MTLEEKNAYNEERILYLEAENEYLKNHELQFKQGRTDYRKKSKSSKGYHKFLSKKGIIQSMSRKGNCLDNLPIENFLWKNEMFYGNKYTYQS